MDEIEQIRAKLNIVDFINEYLPLKKAGRNFRANCPFHSEKTPSFIVSPERQIWHCFGACGEGGDIFRFLMKWENLEFPEALRILAKRAGIRLREYTPSDESRLKEKLYEVNHLASEFYHWLLLNHPSGKKALDYVLGRGITKKSIELFKLGWAPNLWEGLTKFLVGKKGYKILDLDQAGLLVKGERGYYDRFRGRLMFTLKNHRDETVGFAGRTLDPQVKEAKYINTPETQIYIKGNILYGLDLTREAIKKEDRAIVVEGEFDLIQAYQAGSQNVAAIKGTALTEGQVGLLKRYTENLSLALDADLAGDAAVRRGIEIADRAGLNIRVIRMEKGKDPDECIRQDASSWFKAVKKAVPFYDFLLDSAVVRYPPINAEAKKKISQEILPVLAGISHEIVKAHYVKKLARQLEVSEEVILSAMAKIEKKEEVKGAEKGREGRKTRQEILEEYLLSLVLQSHDAKESFDYFLSFFDEKEAEKYFIVPSTKRIFGSLLSFLASHKFQIEAFIRTLPKELTPVLDYLYLKDWGKAWEEEGLKQEVKKVALGLKILALKRELKEISAKMHGTEDEEKARKLTEQFQKISQKLTSLN